MKAQIKDLASLKSEIEGLKAFRQLAERSQEQIAETLGIKQPSVAKIEKQTCHVFVTVGDTKPAAKAKPAKSKPAAEQ